MKSEAVISESVNQWVSECGKWLAGVIIACALLLAPPVQAQPQGLPYEPKQFPSFTSETLVANGIVTNQQSWAVRNLGSIYNSQALTNRATALQITPGYPIAISASYTCATANNSNVVIGFALSADGTNYTDASGDMLLATIPGSGGAHTNRGFTTNFSASVLGGAQWISIRHLQNINAASATSFKVFINRPKI